MRHGNSILSYLLVSAIGWLVLLASSTAATLRVTTWNLEWFPNGSPKEASFDKQAQRINAAADVLRPLKPDIILLQEIKDYDACSRLAEAIQPHAYKVAVCSAFKERQGNAKQQVAVLAKEPAQAAWSEPWKSLSGVDPPRGFAFAWFKINGADLGVYSVHLKSNLVMHGDKAAESAKNIRKREVAAQQILNHIHDMIAVAMPNVRSIIIGGDFNTSTDEFGNEATLKTLGSAGFTNCMDKLRMAERITHPASRGYPDATFDYLFARNASLSSPKIVQSKASDHLPVTCEITIDNASMLAAESVRTSNPAAGGSPSFVTVTQAVEIQILYGKTVIPKGIKLPVVSLDASTVRIRYMNDEYSIPISSTDLR
jgi:endonuclease/exonuclease/phosphatase family metal-dependent hydrolase